MSSLRQRLQFTSVIDNSIKHPVINNSKRSTQKFTTSSRIILSISVLATIILSSYYFGTDTHSRVVTPLPIAELHRKRGNLQVYDMDKAHFIWSKRSDESIFTKLKPWQRHNQMPGRVFNKTRSDFPCHLNETEEKTKGLMFVKIPKCASSTSAGINMRIATRYPQQYLDTTRVCIESSKHRRASEFFHRDPNKSFLWSMVRDPTRRAVSSFFHFQVGRKGIVPNDANFLSNMKSNQRDFISEWVAVKPINQSESVQDRLDNILQDYNFIGLVERLDESLVALQMILGLDTTYILHLNSKTSGGFDDGLGKGGCAYVPQSFVSDEVKDYFDSSEWKDKIQLDVALWKAVNRSLDETIDKLGRKKFNEQFKNYQRLSQVVKDQCSSEAIFPCSDDGTQNKKSNDPIYFSNRYYRFENRYPN